MRTIKLSNLIPLFILYFTLSSFSFVNNQDGKQNHRDENGKKQGKWVYLGKDRPSEGYPAEGKVEEGTYVDDRKEGMWVKYHADGVTPKLKGEYANNRPNGSYEKLNVKGIVIEKGVFSAGKYRDSLVRYHDNGEIAYLGFYNDNGNEEGKIRHYYANGKIEFEYNSDNGKPRGKAIRYYENGDKKEVLNYNDQGQLINKEQFEMVNPQVKVVKPEIGPKESAPSVSNPNTKGIRFSPNGYNKVYNANHEIWQDGEFKNGRLWDGKVYEYDRDGILLKVKVFKNGAYHSDGQLN